MTFDTYIETVESLSTNNSTEVQQQALEAAADSLAFVQGLNDTFRAQGVSLPEVPDLYKLEGVVDSYVGELVAAVILLSNAGMGSTPEMLEKLEEALNKQVPVNVATGFLRLADRVRKTRVAQQKLTAL